MDLFRGISSPWCFSERSAVGVLYQNEISASSMKIVKLLSSSDVLKDTTCFERTKYKLFETDHYFSSGGRGGDKHCFACKKLIFFLFAATNNLCGGLHTIYFGLLRLQIILFSLSGSANNLLQHFPFPTPLANSI